jgi:serine/threonine protein kinase
LRRLVLVELIKVDLEERVARGLTLRRIEDYAAEFPELTDGGVPCDLLYEEFHVRRRAGEPVRARDYRDRFPAQAAELERLLGAKSTYATTAVQSIKVRAPAEVGERLDDFDLLTLLGEGNFARVFLARQQSLQRLVALKVSADRGAEPQTLAQLDHPHIVRVYDQRVLPDRNMRLLYMPYLAGGTLGTVLEYARQVPAGQRTGQTVVEAIDRVLERRGEQPPEALLRRALAGRRWWQVVCWLGARLAGALHYAHQRGVLHRDVKPANVLLGADGSPRLADFNVGYCSKLDGASPKAFFGGSLVYMSPEQMEAFNPAHDRTPDTLDGRSDVYSLGVTLWELLTARRPFADEALGASLPQTLTDLTRRRRAGLPADAAAHLPPDCPPALERVLRKCLAPDPADRFATAGELARALDLCLQPRAQDLLEPAGGGWRGFARRRPLWVIIPAGLVPNVLAGWFNYDYNYSEVISHADAPAGLEPAFKVIQFVINAVAFPLGVLLFIWIGRPVQRGLARLARGERPADAELAGLRARSLWLGQYGMFVSLGCWLLASVIYPVSLNLVVPGLEGPYARHLFLQFLASLTVCGLVAAAYPFFAGTFLSVRAIYPAFLRPGTATDRDWADLSRLERSLWGYLTLAAAVPLVGVALLVWSDSPNRTALTALCGAGLIGLAVAVLLARRIQRDLADLAAVTRPPDAGPPAGDETGLVTSWGG